MPRQRSPNRDKAKEIYLKSSGNAKLKDIAEELGVLDTQIRKWKNQDKWDDELKGTLPKTKRNVTNKKRDKETIKKEPLHEEVEEVINNSELTDKQRFFCIHYVKCFNATKAAIKAGYSKDTAGVIGYQLLQKTLIREEIQRLKANKLNRAMLSEDDIFQKWIDIAFSDMNDFMEFGQKELPMLNPISGEELIDEEGNPQTYTVDYAHFKDSSEVDGTLISEVSKGKDGAKMKLQDKIKAMQWLSDRMDLLPTETRRKLEIEEEKVKVAKERLALDKSKVTGNDDEIGDDGFLDALKGQIAEVWDNE